MALNLVRNSRAFFTRNLTTNNGIANSVNLTGASTANTFEIQVLDGFSFSQNTNTETVTVNEAGATPNRGSRTFNTSLAPVDFSFSTYIRPRTASSLVQAEEKVLWNALLNNVDQTDALTATIGTVTAASKVSTLAAVTLSGSSFDTVNILPNDVICLCGMTGNYASEWNSPIVVNTISATQLIGTYLWAPSTAAGTTPAATASLFRYSRSAYVPMTAVAADTLGGNATTAAYSLVHTGRNGVNALLPFGMAIVIDDATYLLDNCALNSAQIDFSLDGIATIQWSGNASALRVQSRTNMVDGGGNVTMTGAWAGTAVGKVTTANYITNKLSTIALTSNIAGVGGSVFTLALTGGNINISNNINYITPANLGVVNTPITYFTGNLSISGSINAYLHSGTTPAANNTGKLLSDLLTAASGAAGVEPKYAMRVLVGGNNATRVEFRVDGAMLSIPSVETQQIISTTINFNAQGFDPDVSGVTADGANTYSIDTPNQLIMRYFSA